MLRDSSLQQMIGDIAIQYDEQILSNVMEFFSSFLQRQNIDLRYLDAKDLSKAFAEFYRKAKVDGTFVRFSATK